MEAWWNYSYNGLWQNKSALDFNFIFDIPGYYPVNLTVFDFRRNSDTDSFNITVLDVKLPKAISQGDIIVNEGSLVHFNGSRSSDSGGIAKYEWIFDYDGTSYTLEGVNVSFFFEKPGWIPVTLRVTDNAGHIGESIFNVTIVDITDPIAEAGLDITIDNGEEAILNGSLCSDNGIITYYNWTFEYNGTVEKVQGKEASFKFVIPGIYPVTLRIEDAFGNHAEDKFNVTVVDTISPKPKILGKTQVLEGESMVLNGLQSTDNGRIVKYLWTFEDEGPEEYEGPTVTHRFTVKGMHEVTLTVFDEWNNSASINITVDVVDISSPLADAGPDMLVGVGREVIFDGSGSTDDGRMVQFEWLFNYQGQANVLEGMVSTFTFDVPGTYIVTLRVHDQSENVGADEVEVKVVNYGFVRGILLDGKGTPIRDADVEIIASDGNAYTTKTLANGSFYLEVPQGSFTWKITMDGFKDLSGSGTVGLLSATTLDVPAMEKADSTGTSPILFIVPAVLILLLIIGIAIFLMMRKKGSNEETEESIPEKEPEIPTDIIPTVPPIDPSLSEFTEAPPVEEEPAESFMKGGSHGIGDLIEE